MTSGGRIVAIVQARMGSTRLPGKCLLPLLGRSVLDWVLRRVKRARRVQRVVVATTESAADDLIVKASRQSGAGVFRGSEKDVLGRFAAAAKEQEADWVVRINADNPLVDPARIDELAAEALSTKPDYASYRRADGKPAMLTAMGFFAEIVRREALDRADREIRDPFEREHVTLGIYQRPDAYRVRWLEAPPICCDPRLRMTIDSAADFQCMERLFEALGPRAEACSAEEAAAAAMAHDDWLAAMDQANRDQPKKASR